MRQSLELQNARPRRREKPYFVWKRNLTESGVRWRRWDPPWDSYEEAAEAAYRMAGGGRGEIDPYFNQKFNELYVGQQSPVDRWGRYKSSTLAHQYSKPGHADYTWIPGRAERSRDMTKKKRASSRPDELAAAVRVAPHTYEFGTQQEAKVFASVLRAHGHEVKRIKRCVKTRSNVPQDDIEWADGNAFKYGGPPRSHQRGQRPPSGKSRKHTSKDAAASFRQELQEIARAQGWRVERTEKGHWRFVPPDKSKRIVVLPGTSVSRSGTRNALADLRRSGLIVERDHRPARDVSFSEIRSLAERAQNDPTNTTVVARLHEALLETFHNRPATSENYDAKVRQAEWYAQRHGELTAVMFFPDTLDRTYDEARQEPTKAGFGRSPGSRFLVIVQESNPYVSIRTKVQQIRQRRPGGIVTYLAHPRI